MDNTEEIEARRLLGQRIRDLRTGKNLSMQVLANLAEIELSQIARIETAKINPKVSTLIKIARALEISPSEFFVS
jgi:transcriptional regulator with XRE-family HTH domain